MSKHSSVGPEWDAVRVAILKRDGYVCGYCGAEADTVDHMFPKVRGGTDDPSNLIACCRRCNSIKKDQVHARVNYFNKKWLAHL